MLDFKLNKALVLSLAFFVLVLLFGFWSLIALTPLVLIVLFKLFKDDGTNHTVTLLDLAFIGIALSELCTALCSTYVDNGNNTAFNLFVILFLYIAYKGYFKSGQKKFLFSMALFFLTVLLALLTTILFGLHYTNVLDNGFTELNNFKNLYNPMGIWNNLWACILLLLLPFTLIFLLWQKKRKVKVWVLLILTLLVFGLTVSFSRGIYVSLVFFIVTLNVLTFKQLKTKQLLIGNGIAMGMLALSIFLVKDSVSTTMAFNKTVSQQRSTTGRIDRWSHALQLVKDRSVTGWGNGNFILARDSKPYLPEDALFSSKIDNTYLQILIEKGALGLLAYFFLFFACTFIVFKGLRNKGHTKTQKLELALIFSGLVAFLVRELTFSSLFGNNSVYFLAFHLVYFLIPYDIGLKKIKIPKVFKSSLLLMGLGISIYLVYTHVQHAVLNNRNNQFVRAYQKGERSAAFDFLDEALKMAPDNLLLNKHRAVLLSQIALQINISRKHPELLEFKTAEKDTLELSKKYLKKILKSNPYDDETYHNLGWVYFALNQRDSAEINLKRTLELRPYNSTYRISNILFDLKNGRTENVKSDLTRAIRYSPDILESPFYKEFSLKYPKMAAQSLKKAISGLGKTLAKGDNPILKARLARLLLEENPDRSRKLLKETTTSLPNLSRPWVYLAHLEEKQDTAIARKYYEKAIFLSNGDFLPLLYDARFNRMLEKDKKSIGLYKEALQAYGAMTMDNYRKNWAMSGLSTIANSYIPNDLLYYTAPVIPYQEIFEYFIDYYKEIDDSKTMEFYQDLSKKYKNQIYKGKEKLR